MRHVLVWLARPFPDFEPTFKMLQCRPSNLPFAATAKNKRDADSQFADYAAVRGNCANGRLLREPRDGAKWQSQR